MSYRCIYIKSADQMQLKDQQLLIHKSNKEVTIPLEDISMILIEDNRCKITGKLLSKLAENYIGVLICDDKFIPNVVIMPLHMHYKQLKVFETQINVKKTVNSQLWEKIIRKKIQNQMIVIRQTTNDFFSLEKLTESLKTVKSADKTNREAIAAKYFFDGIYGSYFTRKKTSDDEINSCLNYGYTILIACMSRMLAMYGFNTILGIHHNSMTNNFNLSCDLVEPFRPAVDYFVYKNLDNLVSPLTTDVKKGLLAILASNIELDKKIYKVEHAMEEVVLSYIKVLNEQNADLLQLPNIVSDVINEDDVQL